MPNYMYERDPEYVMTELDIKALGKGFNYKMIPEDSTFDAMYARDIKDIETIEEMFDSVSFRYITIGTNIPCSQLISFFDWRW